MELKNVEKRIINELQKDSRLSLRQLAFKTGISATAVSSYIKRLETDGVIEGYFAKIDFEKLGYELTAITEIIASKGKLEEVEKEISKNSNVLAVYDITGKSDAMVISKFRKRKELDEFIKSLLSNPNVERTNTHIVLNTVKEDFRIMLD